MRAQTRSPTPCASRSRRCANGLGNRGSSPRSPASATASTRRSAPGSAPDVRAGTVDRAPGLTVRLKLTLSYAGLLMLAGAVLLGAVWVFLLRYVPDDAIYTALGVAPNRLMIRGDVLDALRVLRGAYALAATIVLAFLLV